MIQPMISLAGHVVGPIYLCLQEPSGRFGERVKENLFRANNVIVTCSKSGKLDTTLVQYWFYHVFLPSTPRKSLLISDSWTGHKDPDIYAKSKGCKRVEIPKNTTDQIQPLNVFYNRQMKSIIRKILLPRRSNSTDGKRHVRTAPVRLKRSSTGEHKKHVDQYFAMNTINHLKTLTSMFGSDAVIF
ncbi:unnamed protein product [Rotaria magnacalcarata]|nr:unnamed protein product [Rotaria magnacalcarata]